MIKYDGVLPLPLTESQLGANYTQLREDAQDRLEARTWIHLEEWARRQGGDQVRWEPLVQWSGPPPGPRVASPRPGLLEEIVSAGYQSLEITRAGEQILFSQETPDTVLLDAGLVDDVLRAELAALAE